MPTKLSQAIAITALLYLTVSINNPQSRPTITKNISLQPVAALKFPSVKLAEVVNFRYQEE